MPSTVKLSVNINPVPADSVIAELVSPIGIKKDFSILHSSPEIFSKSDKFFFQQVQVTSGQHYQRIAVIGEGKDFPGLSTYRWRKFGTRMLFSSFRIANKSLRYV
jgi:hypothetical protein